MLYKGNGIKTNIVLAEQYFHMSADKGNPKYMFYYGIIMISKPFVPLNLTKGAKYIKMAAKKGVVDAMSMYGAMLFLGIGVKKKYY